MVYYYSGDFLASCQDCVLYPNATLACSCISNIRFITLIGYEYDYQPAFIDLSTLLLSSPSFPTIINLNLILIIDDVLEPSGNYLKCSADGSQSQPLNASTKVLCSNEPWGLVSWSQSPTIGATAVLPTKGTTAVSPNST